MSANASRNNVKRLKLDAFSDCFLASQLKRFISIQKAPIVTESHLSQICQIFEVLELPCLLQTWPLLSPNLKVTFLRSARLVSFKSRSRLVSPGLIKREGKIMTLIKGEVNYRWHGLLQSISFPNRKGTWLNLSDFKAGVPFPYEIISAENVLILQLPIAVFEECFLEYATSKSQIIQSQLQQMHLFSTLTAKQFRKVYSHLIHQTYRAKDKICKVPEQQETIYFILYGQLEIRQSVIDSEFGNSLAHKREARIVRLGKGQFCVLSAKNTAVCLEALHLLQVPLFILKQLLPESDQLVMQEICSKIKGVHTSIWKKSESLSRNKMKDPSRKKRQFKSLHKQRSSIKINRVQSWGLVEFFSKKPLPRNSTPISLGQQRTTSTTFHSKNRSTHSLLAPKINDLMKRIEGPPIQDNDSEKERETKQWAKKRQRSGAEMFRRVIKEQVVKRSRKMLVSRTRAQLWEYASKEEMDSFDIL